MIRKEKDVWVFANNMIICYGNVKMLMEVLGVTFKHLKCYKVKENPWSIDIYLAVTIDLKREEE